MTREEAVLGQIKREGYGLEIGPAFNGIAPKRLGFNVHIMDHLSRPELVEKYRGVHPVDKIEEVDFIWRGERYAEITGRTKFYDWIIASHVVEHTPDFVGFLNNCDEVLKDDGVLILAVPDRRYMFDYFRPLTSIGRVIDSHLEARKAPTPGSIVEYHLNFVQRDGHYIWQAGSATEFEYDEDVSFQRARELLDLAARDEQYHDVHTWCFVPHSFRLMVYDLHRLGLIALQEAFFYSTETFEFYVSLSRQGRGSELARLELLNRVEAEVAQTKNKLAPLKQEIASLRQSLSWRVTSPLRVLGGMVRGRRRS